MPRGLRFGGDDGHLAAHQRIHQGGFADIGPADDGNMTGAKIRLAHTDFRISAGRRSSSFRGGQLLSAAAAGALAHRGDAQHRDLAADRERLRMRIARDRGQACTPAAPDRAPAELPAGESWGP